MLAADSRFPESPPVMRQVQYGAGNRSVPISRFRISHGWRPDCSKVVTIDVINKPRYYWRVIRTYQNKKVRGLFENGSRLKGLPGDVQRRVVSRLQMLHAAKKLADLRVPPGNGLESLKGNRKGQHSIRINNQYRLCFVWRRGDAYDVEVVDYHT